MQFPTSSCHFLPLNVVHIKIYLPETSDAYFPARMNFKLFPQVL